MPLLTEAQTPDTGTRYNRKLISLMNETYQDQKKENRKFLVWFLIAVAVAILPWFFLLD